MARGEEQLPLAELDLTFMTAGWGEPKVDLNCTGNPGNGVSALWSRRIA